MPCGTAGPDGLVFLQGASSRLGQVEGGHTDAYAHVECAGQLQVLVLLLK
jgi:hypothetical protein